jgi:hypothetical protein
MNPGYRNDGVAASTYLNQKVDDLRGECWSNSKDVRARREMSSKHVRAEMRDGIRGHQGEMRDEFKGRASRARGSGACGMEAASTGRDARVDG